jgi:hypothetical protein
MFGMPTLAFLLLNNFLPKGLLVWLTPSERLIELAPFILPVLLIMLLFVSITISTAIYRKKEF